MDKISKNIVQLTCITVLVLSFCTAQRTYMRSCDCEYIDNGRCAYTLMIPLPGNGDSDTCPKQGTSTTVSPDMSDNVREELDELQSKLDMFGMNISALQNDQNDQMRMIAQLQSRTMNFSDTVENLQEHIMSLKADTNDSDSDAPNSSTCCQGLNQTIQELQLHVNRAMLALTNLANDLNQTTELVSDNKIAIVDLQNDVAMQNVEIADLTSDIHKILRDYYLCSQKGLLVSGEESFINDSSITVSSTNNSATLIRINTEATANTDGAWCPGITDVPDHEGSGEEPDTEDPLPREYVQFDLGSPRAVFGVVTRGRSDYGQSVTSYQVEYTNELQEDSNWTVYQDVIGNELIFDGNTDNNSTQTNMFWQPITARYVRIIPLTGRITTGQMGNRCMRADLIGCVDP